MSVTSSLERVLVVPAAELDRLGRFQGFCAEAERYLDHLFQPRFLSFRSRSEMETNPEFKQIIPYVVFRAADSVFCYRRGTSQGEARLHRKRSLGVGGHVDEADADGEPTRAAYELALRRELEEEVSVRSPGVLRLVGLINDDATPVGEVHLGVVHLFDLERPEVEPREAGLIDCGFERLSELAGRQDDFETWSRICLDEYLLKRSDRD